MPLELKRKARRLVPPPLRQRWADRADTRRASADDLAGAFSAIYENGEWGEGDGVGFYSGPGSEDHNTRDFVDIANRLIEQHGLKSVVDIGCGDFRVGAQIARPGINYLGVDIFGPLIEQHRERHGRPGLEFRQLDATREALPTADLCLIREVLQHLPNASIAAILAQMPKFRFALIAEAHPKPGTVWKWNADKAAAGRTRLFFDSGVKLDAPPFNLSGVTRVASKFHDSWVVRPGETVDIFLVTRDA